MKNIFLITLLWILILPHISGQETDTTGYENFMGQETKKVEYKKNRFSILLDLPGFDISWGDLKDFNTNAIKSVGAGFDYNFSEIISLGLHVLYNYDHITFLETKEEEKHQALAITPVLKLNLGRNQIFVPFLEVSYTASIGRWYCNYEDNYTTNYVRHIIHGGVGVKLYASRWFKKTKYKNNFGIDFCMSKSLFLFDNSVNVPLFERTQTRISFFYRF